MSRAIELVDVLEASAKQQEKTSIIKIGENKMSKATELVNDISEKSIDKLTTALVGKYTYGDLFGLLLDIMDDTPTNKLSISKADFDGVYDNLTKMLANHKAIRSQII